jgi:hypothetical protein
VVARRSDNPFTAILRLPLIMSLKAVRASVTLAAQSAAVTSLAGVPKQRA